VEITRSLELLAPDLAVACLRLGEPAVELRERGVRLSFDHRPVQCDAVDLAQKVDLKALEIVRARGGGRR